ncbi:MATE family efflux transporter [Streptomyces sp. Je 1-4]|uniref:MATE family efflux transporter n=1 Tax=Streptomyces TaxID=1883 RepID=UPI0021D94514|nr:MULTISPECIES: MATE family efflux transporter [unclassified Streptomyces]UYB43931.1 MATE family efflux transporter [Streptomyces sp. Je 1-4]UZQ40353.1 MATE family efflux transporter [Streptomyces sp. Je 1-4] [Streptomyces sp. Je 1-4 4N24]UZQ47770.1 MATE family efflux transporter [Streptomyces sp. Je 1-4] [Streptomyces sp. Je 1-4 4N24_ara]
MPTTLLRDSRALAALAVPLILTQLAQVALTTTDTVMMGLLGTEELAAGGLALVIFNQLRTMGVGLLTSVGNQVATAAARTELTADATEPPSEGATEGEREAAHAEIRALVRASLVLATLAGLAGAVLMLLIGQALTWLGQDASVVERTRAMLLALAPGLLPCLWFQAIRQFTVGMRRPQALLQITLASIAVNAGLNWVFLHGTWGLPRLGLTGIGVATSTVHLLSCLALYLSAKKDAQLAPLLSLNAAKADRATSLRLVGLGVPIAATYGSEAGFFSLTALMAGSFGPAALAAHTAVNQLVYIVFQVAVGISHAASINVSRELALGRTDDARRLKNTALACAAAVMTLVGIAYLSVPRVVLFPFLDSGSEQALGIATHLLMVTAVLQFFDCAQNIGVGLLRGLDDTKSGFRITLIGYWAVGLPASWLLAYALDLATLGIWLGLLTGLATTALLLLRRYTQQLAGHRSQPVPA